MNSEFLNRYDQKVSITLLTPNKMSIKVYNILYHSCSGIPECIVSIDPEGGPYLEMGNVMTYFENKYKILSINDEIISNRRGENEGKRYDLEIILTVLKMS